MSGPANVEQGDLESDRPWLVFIAPERRIPQDNQAIPDPSKRRPTPNTEFGEAEIPLQYSDFGVDNNQLIPDPTTRRPTPGSDFGERDRQIEANTVETVETAQETAADVRETAANATDTAVEVGIPGLGLLTAVAAFLGLVWLLRPFVKAVN